ncbi:FAD:protein FMN transferase [Skermanella mucosa]|uniref:FAD:protein FMN transferase n=1 Tax=Skermanella mucosa TaxID=1789672 RepID=UPI00192C24BB|nr:FAD:protein FMN transferase [Skermanella mucosa]UEM21461.1 FAD:protein FMN transferase [Skermanella mucosa]
MTRRPTRRRFLAITAASAGLTLLPPSIAPAEGAPLRVWRGTALGADACLQLSHPDPDEAERLIRLCLDEVARLERVFSLYRPDSALVRLNRAGELADPPLDLVRLLNDALRFSRLTDGMFDVTVQPLWRLYAEHFGRPGADPGGPPAFVVAAARSLVDYRALNVQESGIWFTRTGMEVTLNGIAQGYITDRVADRLRAEGMTNVLVDMGEVKALGRHPDGRRWVVGLPDGEADNRIADTMELTDQAIATSSVRGTRFDFAGRFGHIFDPCTGRCADQVLSATVTADNATAADALSTALTATSSEHALRLMGNVTGAEARIWPADGNS